MEGKLGRTARSFDSTQESAQDEAPDNLNRTGDAVIRAKIDPVSFKPGSRWKYRGGMESEVPIHLQPQDRMAKSLRNAITTLTRNRANYQNTRNG